MLYFNYVANIIKFGICWDDGHVGICGGYVGMRGGDMCYMRDGWWVICRNARWGYVLYAGRVVGDM